MGSDGTLGLRAIKEKAGLVLVQEPASAKFDSMPSSAIDAGLADMVAPAEELPGKIIDYLRHTPRHHQDRASPLEEKDQSALEKVLILLRAQTGHDFSLYKKNTIYRRIERRMGIHQIDRIAAYVRYLQENPQEVELLFKELLIGVTSFFRDPEAWEQLQDRGPPGTSGEPPGRRDPAGLVAGCSTGEEAYSLAIVFKEALEQAQARRGISRCRSLPPTWTGTPSTRPARGSIRPTSPPTCRPSGCSGFSSRRTSGYRVGKEIREMVTFAAQNVIMDPPFTKLDILICRNLLIYLTPELQKKLLPLFHYSLNPGGILFLGSAETIGAFTDLFAPLNSKSRLFRRRESVLQPDHAGVSAFVCPRPRRASRRESAMLQACRQPPGAGRPAAPAALLAAGRAGQRQGRHPLYQRPDRQISGTGGRQGQLEHLRHGPRRTAL